MPRIGSPPPAVTIPPRPHIAGGISVLPPNASELIKCATKICLHDPKLFELLMSIAGVSKRGQPSRFRLFAASLVTMVLGLFVGVGLVSSKRYLGLTVMALGVYFFWNNFKQHPEDPHSAPSSTRPPPIATSESSTSSEETIYSQLPVDLQEDRPVSQVNSKINIDEE